MPTQSIEVTLLGQKIALKTSGDPEVVQQVVELVTSRIKDMEKRSRSIVPHHVALLALLDLAQDYVQAKNKTTDHLRKVDQRTQELLNLVEAEFK